MAQFHVGQSGAAFTCQIPIIDAVLDRVVVDIGFKLGLAIYRKAIMAAGRVSLKAVQGELKRIYGRKLNKRKSEGLDYGNTGALPAAMRVVFRTAENGASSYAVVGTDRELQVPARRGKKTVYERPANTVHLANRGFTAVSRVAGVSGRQTNYSVVKSLRNTARREKVENAANLGMRRLLENNVDRIFLDRNQSARSFVAKAQYIARYKAATKTEVPGRKFMEVAAALSRDPAVAEAMRVLQMEFDKALQNKNQGSYSQ